jgi:hypothetical protein
MLMARIQTGTDEPRLAEVDLWADGARLLGRIRDDAQAGQLWIDGSGGAVLHIARGKVTRPGRHTIERSLQLALAPAPSPAQANSDRIAGHPCTILTDTLSSKVTLTRCMWRGLPLSIELQSTGFSFNAAATLVEEGKVTAADLQPPPGAPAAPASMSAGR